METHFEKFKKKKKKKTSRGMDEGNQHVKLKEQVAHGSWCPAWEPTWPLAKVPKLAHTLSFYPGVGEELSLFSLHGQHFADKGRFSKLLYLGMKLGYWSKFQMLHIEFLSTPGCRNWGYVPSTDSSFRDTGWFSEIFAEYFALFLLFVHDLLHEMYLSWLPYLLGHAMA